MSPESRKKILIIDDDITVRKLIGFHLAKSNYGVFSAEGPDEGFQYLQNEKVDLVLCDVSMDGMDGFAFCRKVREDEKFRVLPFIFVTARNTIEDRSKVLEAGGDDLVTKPFEIEELILKIQMLLRRSDIYKVYGVKKNLEKTFSPGTPRVLLVDDDPSMAKLFLYNLEKAGYDCRFAEGANEGCRTAKEFHPDIIISDIMMPEVDGFAFRKMLLGDPSLKNIPFVFLTAKGGEDDILGGYELGINDYVVKTAGPKVVLAKINAILKSLGKERQKVVTELHEAADSLRVKVVPENPPALKDFEISQWHQSFQGIPGGDFIDYYSLDQNNIAIVLGDVMGKKWGAWYFAFAYAGYVRSALRGVLQNTKTYSPSQILQNVNKSVYHDSKISEVFATISILILNTSTGQLSYAGAGDLPLVYRRHSGEIKKIESKGLLLGFASEGNYRDFELTLEKNDSVILATDGAVESRNKEGVQFGYDGLCGLMKQEEKNSDLLSHIKNSLTEFTGGVFEDDVSLIVITSVKKY